MKEKAFLIIYFFRIPIRFSIYPSNSVLENSIKIEDIQIETHIDYLSEYGTVVSSDSKKDVKVSSIWISNDAEKRVFNPLHGLYEYSLDSTSLKINDILASKLANIQLVESPGNMGPLNFRYNIKYKPDGDIIHADLTQDESENPKQMERRHSFGQKGMKYPDSMYFKTSNFNFQLIKYLQRFGSPGKIFISYSELQTTPLFVTFFLHLPVILTSIIIVILILSFESGVSSDLIQNEISKLPLQKYSEHIEFTECPICLDTFQFDEEVRVLSCKHCFHKTCIDFWLRSMLKCPICRNSVTKLADSPSYELYQSLNSIP